MELSDIMPIEKWKQLAEDIYNRFGFNGAVYDKNDNVFAKSEGWANKVCPAIKAGESRVSCASAQQRCSKESKEKEKPVIVECDAGLIKFVVPIFVNNELVGTAGGCGYLAEESEVDDFYVSKLLKKEEKEVKPLLPTIQRISQKKLEETIRYVQDQIAEALRTKNK